MIPLLKKAGPIGVSNENTWNNMQDTLFTLGVIEKKIDVSSAYVNKFVAQ